MRIEIAMDHLTSIKDPSSATMSISLIAVQSSQEQPTTSRITILTIGAISMAHEKEAAELMANNANNSKAAKQRSEYVRAWQSITSHNTLDKFAKHTDQELALCSERKCSTTTQPQSQRTPRTQTAS